MSALVPEYMRIRRYVMSRRHMTTTAEKLPSEREMGTMFGVSRVTVRRALEDLVKENVVFSKPRGGNFIQPSQNITNYYSKHPDIKRIGLLVASGAMIHYGQDTAQILSGVYRACGERRVLTMPLSFSASDASVLLDDIKALKLDGILSLSSNAEFELMEKIFTDKAACPVSMGIWDGINTPIDNYAYLPLAEEGYLSAERLIKAGCKKIAYLARNLSLPGSNKEFSRFKDAFDDYGVAFDQQLILNEDSGVLDRLHGMMIGDLPFDGIFCRSIFCQDVYRIAQENNLKIPEDFLLLTEDDVFTCGIPNSPTMITKPHEKMGYKAASKLLDILEGKTTEPVQLNYQWEFIEGNSCPLPENIITKGNLHE